MIMLLDDVGGKSSPKRDKSNVDTVICIAYQNSKTQAPISKYVLSSLTPDWNKRRPWPPMRLTLLMADSVN